MSSTGPRPLIALNGLLTSGDSPRLELATRYAASVAAAGGVPLALPPIGGAAEIDAMLERVDGLLLTGGDDFGTERLGLGPTHPSADPVPAAKQDWDFELARRAVAGELPVLGICYGMQLLGLAEGAGLLQHLPEERPESGVHTSNTIHPVRVQAGTKLRQLLGVEQLPVVSRHHQALSEVGPPWRVSAADPSGLVEAIEREGPAFAVGVQWHPELPLPEAEGADPHAGLFRGLVDAAAVRMDARLRTSSGTLAVS